MRIPRLLPALLIGAGLLLPAAAPVWAKTSYKVRKFKAHKARKVKARKFKHPKYKHPKYKH
jgi:hypothetical protein